MVNRRLGFKFKQMLTCHDHGCEWSKWKESEIHWRWEGFTLDIKVTKNFGVDRCTESAAREIQFSSVQFSHSVVSNSVRPHRRQPTRLPCPWDSPGKNTGVGCHFLLQCMKVKRESEVVQSCPTLRNPMDCSLPGFSVHGIFQAKELEWGAIVCIIRNFKVFLCFFILQFENPFWPFPNHILIPHNYFTHISKMHKSCSISF